MTPQQGQHGEGRSRSASRPALNDQPGRWKVTLTERTSGLSAKCELTVR